MRAVITVVGKDCVGILANVSEVCAKSNVNIADVSQSILQDMFCMIMMADISKCNVPFIDFKSSLESLSKKLGLSVHVMHEDIFNSMHKI